MNLENSKVNGEAGLNRLFEQYRRSCPEPEASATFLPSVWLKIEGRQNFWYVFQHFGKAVTTASAAICLLLLVLNLVSTPAAYYPAPTYADALLADHSAETTYYGEAIRNSLVDDEPGGRPAH